MSDNNPNPFAFPVEGGARPWNNGMTLRDYFAAKSITGINPGRNISEQDIQWIAWNAYRLADAMIKERKNK